jgi:hypothetical protein
MWGAAYLGLDLKPVTNFHSKPGKYLTPLNYYELLGAAGVLPQG